MDAIDIITVLIILAGGFFCFFSAFNDYDWFMNHRKAAFFVMAFGRTRARLFYMALGILMIVVAGGLFTGVIPTSSM